MPAKANIENPYVGPKPFEQKDHDRFFGRDREANELLSLVIANRMSLLYAQSGAGKTSLLNAKLFPMLREREFEVLPAARVRGLIPNDIPPENVPNPFAFNTLISWTDEQADLQDLKDQTLTGYLANLEHLTDSNGLPAPRIIIFDQFEELFTAYPDRWRDRQGFFDQIVEALQGSPLLIRPADVQHPAAFFAVLQDDTHPFSRFLRPHFSKVIQQILDGPAVSHDVSPVHVERLVTELNRLIRTNKITKSATLKDVQFPAHLVALMRDNPQGESLLRLNRMMLDAAYPQHLPQTSSGDPLLRVLLVIREDFIAQLDPYIPALPNQLRSRLRLMRLQQRAALEAIKKPLEGTTRSFEPGVAERLVDELLKINVETEYGDVVSLKGEYVEPVQLQVVCENLWNDLPETVEVINDHHVRKFGDVNEALAAFYESTIAVTVAESNIPESSLRRFFERTLLTPAGTRGTVYRGSQQTGDIPNNAIDVLEDRHIIRGELRGGSRWYELTHDRFIEPILQSNKKWLAKNVGGQEMLQLLEQKADLWDEKGKKALALLEEFDLARAERWLSSPAAQALEVSKLVRAFVSESRKQIDASTILKERTLARRYRRFLVGIGLLLIPAAFIWIQAILKYRAADERIQTANEQVALLKESETSAKLELEKARLITADAISARDSAVALMQFAEDKLTALNLQIASASDSLQEAQYQFELAKEERLMAEEETQRAVDLAARAQTAYAQAQADRVEAVSGRNEAVAKLNQALALAIADMAKRQNRLGNDSLAALLAKQAYAFDQQGNNLFEGQVYDALRTSLNGLSADSTTQLGGPDAYFDHRGQVRHVAYSPDGRWLVSGGDNDFIRIRDLQTNRPGVIGSRRENIRCLTFSPDGRLLAVCRENDTLELWAFTEDGPAPSPKTIVSVRARRVAFNKEGDALAIIGPEGWLYRWTLDESDGNQATSLYSRAVFRALAVSSDNTYLVAADRTGQLYLWSNWTEANAKLVITQPSEQVVNTLAFSPDNGTFAAGGDDYRLLVWKIKPDTTLALENELLGHLGPINDIVFSKNGRLLASASSDKSIHIRSTNDLNKRPRILQDHDFWVWSVDFNANGRKIATGSGDGTVRVWITDSMELVDKICQLLPGGELSPKEWETYIGNDFSINQYQKPCP